MIPSTRRRSAVRHHWLATITCLGVQACGVPMSASPQTLTSVRLNTTVILGGQGSTGELRFSGPAPSGGLVVRLASSNPAVVTVPTATTGTVKLTGPAPAGGLVVQLSSGIHQATVLVPPTVTVPAGETTASFGIAVQPLTTSANSNITVTLTATAGGVTRTTHLTVNRL